jgi:hypothetical protein
LPDATGGFWLPRTDCAGEGDVLRDGAALEDAEGEDVGNADDKPEGDAGGTGDGDPIRARVGDAVREISKGFGLARFGGGRSAIVPVDEPATAAAASATSPATATVGTSATRLLSGKSSRQLGQKPETGIVT